MKIGIMTDMIIFLGDFLLKDVQPTVWIRGNTDDWLNEIVTGWEPSSEIEKYCYTLFSYPILCVHGSPRSYSESMDFSVPDETVKEMLYGVEEINILCCHIHNPFEPHIKEKWIINVGSVGYPTDGDPRASYGVLEIKKGGQSKYILKRVEYDIDENIRLAKLNCSLRPLCHDSCLHKNHTSFRFAQDEGAAELVVLRPIALIDFYRFIDFVFVISYNFSIFL